MQPHTRSKILKESSEARLFDSPPSSDIFKVLKRCEIGITEPKCKVVNSREKILVCLGCALFRTSYVMSYLSLFTQSIDQPIISLRYWLELMS